MKLIPLHDETVPVACTIESEEIPDRIDLFERMRSALDHIERTEHGLLLHYRPDPTVEADLRRFAVDEKRCCQFWGFDITATRTGLTLRWDAPSSATELVDALHGWFRGVEPMTALSGLL